MLFCWEETQPNQHMTTLGLHWLSALDGQKEGGIAMAPRRLEPGGDAAIFALFCFSLHPLSPGSSVCLWTGNSQFQSKHFSFRKSKWPSQSGSDRVDFPSGANHWAQFYTFPGLGVWRCRERIQNFTNLGIYSQTPGQLLISFPLDFSLISNFHNLLWIPAKITSSKIFTTTMMFIFV